MAQCNALADWLEPLDQATFAQPSALAGWDLRELVAHVVLIHSGLARALAIPSAEPAVPAAEYVTRYRPAVDQIAELTRTAAADRTPSDLIAELRDSEARTVAADVADRAVVLGGRGPILALEWTTTRIVDLVVHCDDISRSVPEREPVPLEREALAVAVRTLAEALRTQAPGRSVELRVPPFVAVQAVAGPRHTRGTPPNVIEADPVTWLRVATGRASFSECVANGLIVASGSRADLSEYLPVLS